MTSDEEFQSAFDEYIGDPLVNEAVLAAADLITEDDHWCRLLHIQVEDNNLDDHWFDDPGDAYAEATDHQRKVFDALKALTEQERVTAVAIHQENERFPSDREFLVEEAHLALVRATGVHHDQ